MVAIPPTIKIEGFLCNRTCEIMGLAVGIDIGGTWIRVALGNSDAEILRRKSMPVDARSGASLLRQLESLIRFVCAGDLSLVDGIGIGAAGRLNVREGTIVYSPNTSLRDVNVKALEKRLRKPVTLLNDNVAAALAERSIGIGRGLDNLVYVGIGTGIGGGAVVDGRVLVGKEGNAHEMGHMIIDIEGRLECSCGGRGHWEAYTSGSGLPNFAKLLTERYGRNTPFLKEVRSQRIEAKDIFMAARRGDGFAKFVLEESANVNAMAFANLVDLYDPTVISVGGGVALKNPDLVIEPIADRLPKFAFNAPPAVVATPLREDAPLLGAILSVFEPSSCEPRD
ncbi:MAG: ROK family protein [Candidatus Verstraetearchaeota archaeon]|nr:ROK family protein [Candidatus Verstraetearchaeota archaeon]